MYTILKHSFLDIFHHKIEKWLCTYIWNFRRGLKDSDFMKGKNVKLIRLSEKKHTENRIYYS